MVGDGDGGIAGATDVPVPLPATLVEALRRRAEGQPDRPAFTFEGDAAGADGVPAALTYGELDGRSRAVAGWLQAGGHSGGRVLLAMPPGLDFIPAFFGCLYAGAAAVPVALPRPNRPLNRLRSVAVDARPSAVLTTEALRAAAAGWSAEVPELAGVPVRAVEAIPQAAADRWHDPAVAPDALAFLQYTSGSTAAPKGVMVSHRNLAHNSGLIAASFGTSADTRGVFWLPLFHDMGLIGGVLQTVWCGGSSALMSPMAFLQRPVRWLEAISRTAAQISGGPNFAYDLCARKVTDAQKAGLDLSGWSVAFNGAEPVRAETLRRFARAFAPCGFHPEAFLPCYGLAESTLLVTGKRSARPPAVVTVRSDRLECGEAVPSASGESGARNLVGSGSAFQGSRVAVVDPERGEVLPDGRVGEVWTAGSSVALGYWGRPAETAEAFEARTQDGDGPWLRTGDLGFLRDGELFVTGRRKDVLIVRGRNVYPQDVEWSVAGCHPLARPEGGAAFAVEVGGEERLVVVLEVERRAKGADLDAVAQAVRAAVAEHHDLDLHAVCLIKPFSLPKTSSGKVRRGDCRRAYLDGTLDLMAGPPAGGPVPRPAAPSTPGTGAVRPAGEIEEWLVSRLAGILGLDPSALDVRRPFSSFGLGSMQAVGLAGDLEAWLGRGLSPTLVYDYPTIEALARHLAAGADSPSSSPAAAPAGPRPVATDAPVAVVGLGCRFPGADGPEAYWSLLSGGVDAVGQPPPGRRAPGKAGAGRAGFLDRVEQFDAGFFGIAPREAVQTDPQQRLLLEVAWEALEDAGLAPDSLRGAGVGVFVGIATNDYGRRVAAAAAAAGADESGRAEGYAATGNALSVAANRLSYVFDFRGPSLAVDTACSSSLVALHLACESLRRGEAEVALAAGVNLVLDASVTATFAAAGMLAPDGRCKAFDAAADGYVRGEGAGVVVLKPLARALADGDPIYAVVLGSAVNQDGRSNGLTAPNREAQEAVLRAAYRRAGVEPGCVDYVEAHGTGTLLGDPIEAAALASVVGRGRAAGHPCAIGSVKTNIGHLEAAAGIAGVIKVALSLRRGLIPASLHYHDPNPHIPFAEIPVRVQTAGGAWPDRGRPALAGVSAFGFGGTNAHAVLEAGPAARPTDATAVAVPRVVPLSAQTPQALRDLARLYRARVVGDGIDSGVPGLSDLAHTAGVRRSHLEHRLAVTAHDRAGFAAGLDAFLAGQASPDLATGRRSPSRRPRCAFVFSGQGSQWPGMGLDAARAEPVFRDALADCDRRLTAILGWSVRDVLGADDGRLEATGFAQPAVFALQVAALALWRSWGVVPDAVVGHSLGEAAAAFAAGALSWDDAAAVVAHRSRLMQQTAGAGLTAALALGEAEAVALIALDPDRLALAGVNGPRSVTVSGDPDAVTTLVRTLRGRDVFAKVLAGRCAFHGPQMDPLLGELRDALAGLRPGPAAIPLFSTVTGGPVRGEDLGPDYWARNLRQTVRFADAAGALAAEGFDTFLEVGPHPALGASVRDVLDAQGRSAAVLATFRRGEPSAEGLCRTLGGLYARGFPVAWGPVTAGGRFCPLPTYPFQRERFWLELPTTAAAGDGRHDAKDRNGSNGHSRVNGSAARNGHPREPATDPEARPAGWFEIEWREVDAPVRNEALATSGIWVVVGGGASGVAGGLRDELQRAGGRCVMVAAGSSPDRVERARRLLDDAAELGPPAGVIDLTALDLAAGADSYESVVGVQRGLCGGLLALAQGLQGYRGPGSPRLWVVTSGSQPAGGSTRPLAVAQATAWGLGRSLALQIPGAWGGLVDLDPADPAGAVGLLAAEVLGGSGEDQVAFRGGRRRVARLTRRHRLAEVPEALPVRPEGTYLVTGGLGDLGLKVARRLAEQGARRLVLVGRHGLPPRRDWESLAPTGPEGRRVAAVLGLEAHGVAVAVAAVDAADPSAMAALFEGLGRDYPPVRGVVHAAGGVDPRGLGALDADTLADSLRAKVAGGWVLHELTRDLPLDFFVAFSSVAAVLGTREAGYAAGNHFLDALAHHRRAGGLPGLSINWGPWEGAGLASEGGRARSHAALGFRPLRAADALDSLAGLVAAGVPQALVADADWESVRELYAAGHGRALLDDLAATGTGVPRDYPAPDPAGGRRFAWGGTEAESRAELVGFFRGRIAEVLRLPADRVGDDQPVDALGLDSLTAIELKHGVERELGVTLPLASLLGGPTVLDLADAALARRPAARVEIPVEPVTPVIAEPATEWSDGPLTAGQRALWALHQLDPSSPAYHVVGAVRVRAALDVEALRRSVQRLVDRHPALRTRFPVGEADGQPTQRVAARDRADFRVEPAEGLADGDLRDRLTAEARRPFDLAGGPLFRVRLYRRSADDYALLLAMHHVVSDFWSVAVLLDELGKVYPAELAGKDVDLPALAATLADEARRQAEFVAGPDGERHWDYWRSRLAGPSPTSDLPFDRPRPPLQTFRGASVSVRLDADLADRLARVGRGHGASLYVTLLSAFQVVLGRFSGREDVVVGTPVAGRGRADLAGVVGYFVNPLPVRSRVDPRAPFPRFLESVRDAVVGGLEHQDFPFPVMADRVQATRDPSRPAVFQVMFVYQKAQRLGNEGLTPFVLRQEGPAMRLGGLPVESIALDVGGAQFDLTVQVAEDAGRLVVAAEYNADLFDPATADRLLAAYRLVLEAIAADPDRTLGDLPLVPADDLARLDRWNGPVAAVSGEPPAGFPELFEARAAERPDAPAVIASGASLTYGALNARANRLARRLCAAGVGPDVRVALAAGRSAETVVGVLAILKAGGAYVPLDPEYPADRLAFMIADSRAPVVLAGEGFGGRPPSPDVVVIGLGEDDPAEDSSNLPPAAGPANLAYVIYTSGSTGTPKGVMVSRANLAASTAARSAHYDRPVGAFLMASSFAFDSSVAGLFWTLGQGGTLVLPEPGEHADPAALARSVEARSVTHLLAVPSLYGLMLDPAAAGRLATLRTVVVAGEACPRDLPARHAALAPNATLDNEYGPTEATVWATVERCGVGGPAGGAVPIGRPTAATRAYVLDGGLNRVPIGVTGELYLAGAGVTRGYLGRPSLTAERFLPDPFAGSAGGRLYRTGDLARFRADGRIDYLGRADGQVKVRGHRIELGEVEALLRAVLGVREAAADLRDDRAGEPSLVGYVVADPSGPPVTAAGVRAAVRSRAPEYLVPGRLVVLDGLPLSPNGKLDREALPDPSAAGPALTGSESVPPRGPIEEGLAAIWVEVLGLEGVGASDDFFGLGGHSLVAARLLARVRESFGVELPLRTLFEAPTVAALARRVEAALRTGQGPAVPELWPAPRGGALPASFAQQRLWFLDKLEPGSPAYNVPAVVRLAGRLDVEALRGAFGELVRRHEVLRTTFGEVDGRPVQVIAEPSAVELPVDDLGGLPESGREAEALRRASAESWRPFDVAHGPLFRARLFRAGPEAHLLAVVMHHIVSDGWSIGVLIREAGLLYAAYTAGLPSPLPVLPVQYADYAAWQRGWLQGPALADRLTYWRKALAGVPALDLPVDHARPSRPSGRGGQTRRTIPQALLNGLNALGRGEQATPFMTLMAAFQALLHRYSGQTDFAVGTPVAGRSALATEGLIGFFVNTLAVRADLADDPSFRGLVRRVRQSTLGAYAHQDLPFDLLVHELRPDRDRHRTPVFQAMFALQNAPLPEPVAPGLVMTPVELPGVTAKFDLTLSVTEVGGGGGLAAALEYSTDLFDRPTAERLLAHFEVLLAGAVAEPDRPVSGLPLWSGDDAATAAEPLSVWGEPGPDPSSPVRLDLDELGRLSDEDVEALIGEYLGPEEAPR